MERLPPEIRNHILTNLDLDGLHALVHAPPIFHQRYRGYRKLVLCRCLETDLGSAAVDAWAASESDPLFFPGPHNMEMVKGFLNSYGDYVTSAQPFTLTERLTEDEAVGMAISHTNRHQTSQACLHPLDSYYPCRRVQYPSDSWDTQRDREDADSASDVPLPGVLQPLRRPSSLGLTRAFYVLGILTGFICIFEL